MDEEFFLDNKKSEPQDSLFVFLANKYLLALCLGIIQRTACSTGHSHRSTLLHSASVIR